MQVSKRHKWMLIFGAAVLTAAAGLVGNPLDQKEQLIHAEEATDDATTREFISLVGERARQIGQERGIYASVMIAQAILESNSGQSTLSLPPNYNLFGIKGKYNGQSVTMKTWEDDGKGNLYKVDADFRAYHSWAASMYDYADLIGSSFYAKVQKANAPTYQDATAALTGTYATDTSYAHKLNALIEQYGLTAYDSPLEADVWNPYRGTYTDAETLAGDESWSKYLQSGAY